MLSASNLLLLHFSSSGKQCFYVSMAHVQVPLMPEAERKKSGEWIGFVECQEKTLLPVQRSDKMKGFKTGQTK
jgi:hypothetical protein